MALEDIGRVWPLESRKLQTLIPTQVLHEAYLEKALLIPKYLQPVPFFHKAFTFPSWRLLLKCTALGNTLASWYPCRILLSRTEVPKRVTAAAKSLQSCPTLCDPIDGSPPGSPIPGILQARTLEWVAISFSSAWKWKVKVKSLSRARLLATPWTAAYQAPPSMGFSMQEYWSGVPLPSPKESHRKVEYIWIWY